MSCLSRVLDPEAWSLGVGAGCISERIVMRGKRDPVLLVRTGLPDLRWHVRRHCAHFIKALVQFIQDCRELALAGWSGENLIDPSSDGRVVAAVDAAFLDQH